MTELPPPRPGGIGDSGNEERGVRELGLTTFALRNQTSVMMLLVIIGIMGILSYLQIPKEANPEVQIPIIAVNTVYPGVSPRDMETLVTRVIEEELNTISDLQVLTSTSVEGYSSIVAEFSTDTDMNEALQKVRERVDLARPDLPSDANEPTIMEFVLSEFPIMQVNVSGDYSLVQLKEVAESLQERLEQIPAILEVRLSGGLEREVRVDVDLPRLQYYGLGFGDVVAAIASENLTIPGGSIDVGNQNYLVRVDGTFTDTRILEDIVVATREQQPIYIRDVATVDFGFQDRTSFARLDGSSVVTLDIVNRSGQNIIETSNAVKAAIADAESTFPPTTVVKVTSDMSEDIGMMVSSLENSIISGLLLVLAVLLFFLGVRYASLVAISIPTSMLLSFMVMNVLGVTMNMVVLFSLILALGMLVDNAIVVVENIYRYRQSGYDNFSAARYGTGEVARPIIVSTITTLAVFAPLMFWPGIVGEFMGYLPLTLIITLSSSLFVALAIVPVLAARFIKLDGAPSRPLTRAARWTLIGAAAFVLLVITAINPLTAVLLALTGLTLSILHRIAFIRLTRVVQFRLLPAIVSWYEVVLRWALQHRAIVVGSSVASFVLAVVLFAAFNTGVEFFPESIPPRTVYVEVDVPGGTNAEFTNEVVAEIERRLPEIPGFEDVSSVVATVGGGGNMFMGGGGAGTVAVNFLEYQHRQADVFETIRLMQQRLGEGIAGADITVTMPENGPPAGAPVNIEISGDDPAVLRRLGDEAIAILRSSPVAPKLEGLVSDMTTGRPELVVEVDRERAALYGLSTGEVGSVIRSAIQGTEAAKFRAGEDEYEIIVRLAEAYRNDLNALQHLTIPHEGRQIPLLSVASWRTGEGSASVLRRDLKRVVTVSSNVRSGENSNAVLADVQTELAEFSRSLPPGYTLRYTGQMQEQTEAQEFLILAFLTALMLTGFILISQFNSVTKPLIMLSSVIMSTVGVLVGLVVFRMPFVIIMTGVGMISLAGVVVNNAIVLIDYVDILRDQGRLDRREALVQAGKTRLRPVILTMITTVLALIPLAIGFNFDFVGLYRELAPELFWGGEQAAWWGGMAVAVIVGLTFATILTLILVPVLYSLVDDLGILFRRFYSSGGDESGDEIEASDHATVSLPPRRRVPAEVFTGIRRWFLRPAR